MQGRDKIQWLYCQESNEDTFTQLLLRLSEGETSQMKKLMLTAWASIEDHIQKFDRSNQTLCPVARASS